MYVAE